MTGSWWSWPGSRTRLGPRPSCSAAPSSSSRSPTRPGAREGPAGHGPCAPQSRHQGRRRCPAQPSAVQQLLGGDSAKAAPAKDSTTARTPAAVTRRGTRRPHPGLRGERRRQHPGRVRGARNRLPPGGQPAEHSGGRAAASPRDHAALGCQRPPASGCSRCRFLYALEDRRIITGSQPGGRPGPARPADQWTPW